MQLTIQAEDCMVEVTLRYHEAMRGSYEKGGRKLEPDDPEWWEVLSWHVVEGTPPVAPEDLGEWLQHDGYEWIAEGVRGYFEFKEE